MAKFKVTLTKKTNNKGTTKPAALKGAVVNFVLQDNGDDTCTVFGVDAAGNTADISTVATLAVVSSDTTKLTVDAPVGMTFAMHAVGPLTVPGTTVNVTATATWNTPGTGPFSFILPCDIVAGPVSGVVIVPGTPTAH